MSFVVMMTADGLNEVNWIGERGGFGIPRLEPRREDAMIFPTREEAESVASEVASHLDDSVRIQIFDT